jgi:histidinol phosphatase-like PHP family hydrolase
VRLHGNLHAHTTFSDGARTPAALVAEYEERGDKLATDDAHRPPQAGRQAARM